mgnify:FL=1
MITSNVSTAAQEERQVQRSDRPSAQEVQPGTGPVKG